ncbi:MAG: hypothetical protein EP330_24115 [Deltaproteobacteria bacterium]|nr:MAG: hypothetical protein EP330_24115 [Deltaproteobacteria bacterium]
MAASIIQQVEALPKSGLTITALETLDSVVPGEWTNVTSFTQLVRDVSGTDQPAVVNGIRRRAMQIEQESARFQQAAQIYALVDRVDQAAAGVAVAGKVGELFGSLGFLKKFTPKPDTTQAVDAGLKLTAELLAFGIMHGMPSTSHDGVLKFAGALSDYARFDLMRIAGWVVFDGLVPLGPDFMAKIVHTMQGAASDKLTNNPAFGPIAKRLPGDSVEEKRNFMVQAMQTTGDWVERFVDEKNLTQQGALSKLEGVLQVAGGGMDYVAAALDASTSYYSHTGMQTVGRTLARQAYEDFRQEVWTNWLAEQQK